MEAKEDYACANVKSHKWSNNYVFASIYFWGSCTHSDPIPHSFVKSYDKDIDCHFCSKLLGVSLYPPKGYLHRENYRDLE